MKFSEAYLEMLNGNKTKPKSLPNDRYFFIGFEKGMAIFYLGSKYRDLKVETYHWELYRNDEWEIYEQ
jgi:hypothetical protein